MKLTRKKLGLLIGVFISALFIYIFWTGITNTSLQERYDLMEDNFINKSINYIDNYFLLGALELPNTNTSTFTYTSPINGSIAFYQIEIKKIKDSTYINNQFIREEECNKKYPPLTLDLKTPAMEQFFQLDENNKIIRDSNGIALKKIPKSVKQDIDRKHCIERYKYGNISLLIKNQGNQILSDSKINKFNGQSILVKEKEKLLISIDLTPPKDSTFLKNKYEIYIKLKEHT